MFGFYRKTILFDKPYWATNLAYIDHMSVFASPQFDCIVVHWIVWSETLVNLLIESVQNKRQFCSGSFYVRIFTVMVENSVANLGLVLQQ